MNKHNNNYIWTFVLLIISAFFMIVSVPGTAICDQVPQLGVENSTRTVPNADGFIQRWLILEPITANGRFRHGAAFEQSRFRVSFDHEEQFFPSSR